MIDPDSPSSILILTILLLLHAVFAATQTAITSLRRSRQLQLIEEGNPAAEMIERLSNDPTNLSLTEHLSLKLIEILFISLAVLTYTAPLTQILSTNNNLIAVIIIVVISAFVILLIGKLIPREIGRNYAEPLAMRLIYPIYFLSMMTLPLARIVYKVGQVFNSNAAINGDEYNPDVITEDELRTYIDASEEGGALNEDEKEMIYSIFNLDDTLAREVMVPRIDIVAVEARVSVEEALDIILAAGHSRLPIYVDSIDNIVGILYAKDLLSYWRQGDQTKSIISLKREAYFVPETKSVSELMREIQQRKIHIAMIVDEYGGVAGLVTLEDILEEIVGEIQDEYDRDEFFMERISDNEFIFSARMDLDDINTIMSIDLPTDESDTLGGLIYTIFGGVPQVGDAVDVDDLHLTVLSVDGRRLKTVKIQRALPVTDQDSSKKTVASPNKNRSSLINNTGRTIAESS